MKYRVERYSSGLIMNNAVIVDCSSIEIPKEYNGYKYIFEDEECNILAVFPEDQVKAVYEYKTISMAVDPSNIKDEVLL